MSRLAISIAALVSLLGAPVLAADWEEEWAPLDDFRGTYANEPKDWSKLGDEDDAVGFEFGTRYWYSLGNQSFAVGPDSFSAGDQSHLGELHLRIDDYSSRSYAKGIAGYSAVITGTYDDPSGTGAVSDGHIGYAGADIGWNAFGDGKGSGFGVFAGYLYWNDSPRTTRADFTTATSASDIGYDAVTGQTFVPFDSVDNNLDINALRLGVSGRAKFGDMFDISGEIAAVPYAMVNGIIGGHGTGTSYSFAEYAGGNISSVKSSETTVNGWGYGAMGEVMVGITPVENLTFRLGGRAWYLQGTVDATYSQATIGDPSDSDILNPPNYDTDPSFSNQAFIFTSNPFSLFRYGLLAEMTYSF